MQSPLTLKTAAALAACLLSGLALVQYVSNSFILPTVVREADRTAMAVVREAMKAHAERPHVGAATSADLRAFLETLSGAISTTIKAALENVATGDDVQKLLERQRRIEDRLEEIEKRTG